MQSSMGIIVRLVGREAGQAQSHALGTCKCVCREQRAYNVCGAKVGLEEWGNDIPGHVSSAGRALTELLSRAQCFLHPLGSCREVQVPPPPRLWHCSPCPECSQGPRFLLRSGI